VVARRPSPKRRKTAGDAQDVSRIEFENIEAVVRGNRERLVRLETRLESLTREITELAKTIRALNSKS
jgi:predicted RNase H-like nuclease (RuvC/YqgF family)